MKGNKRQEEVRGNLQRCVGLSEVCGSVKPQYNNNKNGGFKFVEVEDSSVLAK